MFKYLPSSEFQYDFLEESLDCLQFSFAYDFAFSTQFGLYYLSYIHGHIGILDFFENDLEIRFKLLLDVHLRR